MQTSIRSTTDSTQHGDLPRTENDGGNSWKQLCSSLGLARDDDVLGCKTRSSAVAEIVDRTAYDVWYSYKPLSGIAVVSMSFYFYLQFQTRLLLSVGFLADH